MAGLAGAGFAWWRTGAAAVSGVPVPDFWGQGWDAPDGSRVAAAAFRGRPLLVNFWATWCPPCIEELPLINAFFRENSANGWQVLALAIDQVPAVQAFLAKNRLDFAVAMGGSGGAALARSLGNLAGGLPFSVVLGSDGSLLQRKLGRISVDDLAVWRGLK
ncbi:MAG: TlpA family protein disulfide reductase [Rhodoferax sp.]